MPTLAAGGGTIAEVQPRKENRFEINLIHELGRDGTGHVHERVEVIDPSTTPTRVRVRFEVVGDTNTVLGSAVYLATVRRRKVKAIARAISELEKHAGQDDFTAHTFPVIEQLKTLLTDLANANKEGNTREILRQLRNSFLDGGWEQYRKREARQSATAVLDKLAGAEEVLPEDVKEAFQQLTRNNLNAVGPLLPAFEDEEDEQQDVEEEEEVSR